MATKTPLALAPWLKVDPSLIFDPAEYKGCRKRTKPPQMLVGHWTGGPDFSAAQIVRVLRTRVDSVTGEPDPLSVCFAIEPDGTTYQFTDPDRVVTYHAGKVNDFSLGCELSSPGFPPARKVPRAIVELEVHGRPVRQVAFTPAQIESWLRLADFCADHFGIPKQVPASKGKLFTGVMTAQQAKAWHGFGEHLHFARKKSDAGTQLSRELVAHGYSLEPYA